MNVAECVGVGTQVLTKAGVENPRADVEWLLASCLHTRRMQLYLDLNRDLNPAQQGHFETLLTRRAAREPLQHILGTAEFSGRLFEVDRFVLIPRPETELLAELGVRHVRRRLGLDPKSGPPWRHSRKPFSALDFGTGSGCLAVTLALEAGEGSDIQVSAVDISPDAIEVARRNARRHGCDRVVRFFLGDGFAGLNSTPSSGPKKFDLILTNPPYIPTREIQALQPEVRDHDPVLALDGGEDGLLFYRRLATEALERMNEAGVLMAEFGDGQFERVAGLFRGVGWAVEAPVQDDTGRLRILIARPVAS